MLRSTMYIDETRRNTSVDLRQQTMQQSGEHWLTDSHTVRRITGKAQSRILDSSTDSRLTYGALTLCA